MSNRSLLRSQPWLQAVALTLATWLAVMAVFGRWTWHDWSAPHWLEGDPIEVYARVQIAAEQPGHALTSFAHPARLGAPFGADWRGYAVPDRLVFVLTGALANIVGLIAAVQLVSAFGFVLNAVSFFLCARWLGRRWEWAAAFALGFAFCNYNLRWGITLSLAQTFTLPPLVLLCAFAARRAPPRPAARWTALAVALGLWLGLGNPYLAFFAGVVGGGGLALALARRAPTHRQFPLWCFLGTLTLVFLAANLGYARAHWSGAEAGALTRDLGDFTRYALRPIEWLVPAGDHRLGAAARIGQAYLASRATGGEFFYNYLGLVGAMGLFGLIFWSVRRGRRSPLQQSALLGLLWITLFGLAGGVNFWLGHAGLDVFRASTRIGIFGAVWVAFFLTGCCARLTSAWPRWTSVALAGALALFMVWEQTPPLSLRALRDTNYRRVEAYQSLANTLANTLPAGALIFQLPAAPFPEAGRIGTMMDYEHFLPFLTARTLRFSYGHLRTTAAHRWERHVASLPIAEQIAALQQAGFSAVWIDRRGYADEAAGLIAEFRAAQLAEIPVPAILPITIFRLQPAAAPELPDLSEVRLHETWDTAPAMRGPPLLVAMRGWYGVERAPGRIWRWAAQEATLGIWHAGPPQQARLCFAASGRTGTQLRLTANGVTLWRAALAEGPAQRHELALELKPGSTILTWTLEGKTFRPGAGDPRELGFMIENPLVSVP